jgi:curved DNA-binding protein CbpA
MKKDYYQILQVDPNAEPDVLNGAYRALVRHYHPDRGHTVRAKRHLHERMLEINEAYHVLQDAERRAEYDQARHAAGQGGTSFPSVFPTSSIPPPFERLLSSRTRRLLLWAVITLLAARWLIPPLMGNPLLKAFLLIGLLLLLFRFGLRRKSGN